MVLRKKKKISGQLGSLSLFDMIQLLGVNKRNATLRLDMSDETGTIYFRDGVILHAETGGVEGEDAILRLIDWSEANFVIEEGLSDKPEATMSGDAEALMLKLCSKLDEQKHRGEFSESPASQMQRSRRAAELHPEFAEILTRTERRRSSIPVIASVLFLIIVLTVAFRGQLLNSNGDKAPASVSGDTASADVDSNEPGSATGNNEQAEDPLGSAETTANAGTVTNEIPATANPPETMASSARSEIQPRTTSVPVPAPPTHGFLVVDVDPGTEVVVDGETRGATPLGRIRLSAGEHTIRLSHEEHFGAINDRVTIRLGETERRRYSFNDLGDLQVVVDPWADVFVDGLHVGQTPFSKIKLPVGRHEILLRHPQLGEKRIVIEIRSNETTLLRQQM